MQLFRGLLVLVIAVLLAAAPAALAEEEGGGPPNLISVHYDHVDPSQLAEYEANARKWVEAYANAGMGKDRTWHAYSASDFTYAYVSFMPNYAYLDGAEDRHNERVEKMGEEAVEELYSETGVVSHYDEILKYAPDYSYEPGEQGYEQPGFARVGTHHLRPGMNDEFKALVAKVKAAYEKVGAKGDFHAHEIEFGNGSWAFVSWAKDAASFYSQPSTGAILNEAMGPEETQKLYADWGDCITKYETKDWMYRPDLSFVPGAGEEKEAEAAAAEGAMDEMKETMEEMKEAAEEMKEMAPDG